MKNISKFPILFAVIAISACRSHKTVEVSNYSANDSCEIQTEVRAHRLINVEKTESISSFIAHDHMEFSDSTGEIRINSNGEVSIKGLKSAYLVRHDIHQKSVTTAATIDSIAVQSHEKSVKITTTATKAVATNPILSDILLKFIFLMMIIILLIRIRRSR